MRKGWLSILFWGVLIFPALTQHLTSVNAIWQFIYNGSISDRLSYSASLYPEWIWMGKVEEMPASWALRTQQVNIQTGLAYRWTNNLNLAIGYQFVWRDLDEPSIDLEHRLLEQVTWTSRIEKYRIRGRLRAEQRFFRERRFAVVHRLRLRGSIDFPLQGTQLDPGETYLNAQIEGLTNLSEDIPLALSEMRSYLGLGWQIHPNYGLENGLEWRTRQYNLAGERQDRFFWRLTFFLK